MTADKTLPGTTIGATPIALDDATELVSTIVDAVHEDFGDFTVVTGLDQSGRHIVLIMGHFSGSAAVVSRQVVPQLVFARAA